MPTRLLPALVALAGLAPTGVAADPTDFDRDVRPLLAAKCLTCHGPGKQKGGLRLDRKADALKGGDDGRAIVPGKAAESLLMKLAAGHDADRVMPPTGPRLTADQLAVLRTWIDQGATWPGPAEAANPRDWWSLRQLSKPAVPAVPAEYRDRVRNPIDAFVLAKLKEKGLAPSPEADRRTLIRRLSFDLTGLPPTPEEVAAFEKDAAPDAYEKLVDRLLASPGYGERWARHWLDVVHYGDTHGYDKDKPRPNAWPYRDYVIRSLNTDKPYSRFVQEQLAGDVLFPGTADSLPALGFIAAGPWDFIGHAEVPETKTDGKIARHLDRDDMLATAMNTFAGLTVQCAQCHNHKFDPVSQEEYYRLQAVFAAVDRADVRYHTDPAKAKQWAELTARKAAANRRVAELDAKALAAGGAELADLDRQLAALSKPNSRPEYGYHSALSKTQDAAKWVQLDLGRPVPVASVTLFGCRDSFNNIGDGFGFPVRYRVELSDDPTFAAVTASLAEQSTADQPNPGVAPVRVPANGAKGRYVRVTATKLAPRQNDFIFALAELEVLDAAGKNLAGGAKVTALDAIEAPVRWAKVNLVDGYAPGAAGDRARLTALRDALLRRVTDPADAAARAPADAELVKVEADVARVTPDAAVYAGTVHAGTGNFRGTGPAGRPRPIHVLKRGDVRSPGAEVKPGALGVFPELASHFDLPADHQEGDRRAALAKWVSDPRNPLTWRVIVNRVWQYHFGRALAATANDLGKMGSPPSHPELLDWLAADFRDGKQSFKALHKLIVTSGTYRQSSADVAAFGAIDADNAFLWRQSRRKLEAEAVRDAALFAAGTLDRTMYGPGFQDFVIEHPEHSPHYEYHKANPDDPAFRRRSVYRFLVRSKPQPMMAALDCADPSIQVDRRVETLSPLQALALLNNGFVLAQAKHLAGRVDKDADPVSAAFRLALSRPPTAAERDELAAHAKKYGLPNACRLILNLNEFAFVD